MNKAELQRALKLNAGNTLKTVHVLSEKGEVYNIKGLVFDPENDVFYLNVELVEDE